MTGIRPLVLLRGGGDLATGVGVRLQRCGFDVLVTEIAQPLAVRRAVAFAEAIYAGEIAVEGILARLASGADEIRSALEHGVTPVVVDPEASVRGEFDFTALVDGRMRKRPPGEAFEGSLFSIGLGPGFTAGADCHAVVETNRGHAMGRVIWQGAAEADTGVPEAVAGYDLERVLRAPCAGPVQDGLTIGSLVEQGRVLARVGDQQVRAPFRGALRGLLHDGIVVRAGDKLGDLDPRAEPAFAFRVSDKALAVGGGVLEALLSQPAIRVQLGGSDAARR